MINLLKNMNFSTFKYIIIILILIFSFILLYFKKETVPQKKHDYSVDYVQAHLYSGANKDYLLKDSKCGCFYCLKIFDPKEITDWCYYASDEDTAICPYCGIDSIIGESSGFPITEEFLKKMHNYWF